MILTLFLNEQFLIMKFGMNVSNLNGLNWMKNPSLAGTRVFSHFLASVYPRAHSLSLSLSLSHTHTHTHSLSRIYMHQHTSQMYAHTHTFSLSTLTTRSFHIGALLYSPDFSLSLSLSYTHTHIHTCIYTDTRLSEAVQGEASALEELA